MCSHGKFLLKWTALIVYWGFIYTESHSWLVHDRLIATDIYLYSRLSAATSSALLSLILFLYLPHFPLFSRIWSNVAAYLSPLQHLLRSNPGSIGRLLSASRWSFSRWLPSSWAAHAHIHPQLFDKVNESPPSHYYRTSLHTHDNRIGKEEGTLVYSWPWEHCLDMSHNDVFLFPLSICMNIVRWFVWATAIVDH